MEVLQTEAPAPSCRPNPKRGKQLATDKQSLAPPMIHDTCQLPPDLARVIDAWPALPEPIRAAVMALVGTAAPSLTPRVSDNSDKSSRGPRKGGGR